MYYCVWLVFMMTSSHGNFSRVTGPLWAKSTGHWWNRLTMASAAELWGFLMCALISGYKNSRYAGDLRRHGAHYEVYLHSYAKDKLGHLVTFIKELVGFSGSYIRINKETWQKLPWDYQSSTVEPLHHVYFQPFKKFSPKHTSDVINPLSSSNTTWSRTWLIYWFRYHVNAIKKWNSNEYHSTTKYLPLFMKS